MLIELGLRSFDTVLYNAFFRFNGRVSSSVNTLVQIAAQVQLCFSTVLIYSMYECAFVFCASVCLVSFSLLFSFLSLYCFMGFA